MFLKAVRMVWLFNVESVGVELECVHVIQKGRATTLERVGRVSPLVFLEEGEVGRKRE